MKKLEQRQIKSVLEQFHKWFTEQHGYAARFYYEDIENYLELEKNEDTRI